MHRLSIPWLVALGLAIPGAGFAAIDYAAIRATKRLTALRIDEPIVVDGHLDETAWRSADVGCDFYQQQPTEGALATEQTEIRFLYDTEALYVGGKFYDSDPRSGITNELKRDFSPRDGDQIAVVLDTFRDERTSFGFIINPPAPSVIPKQPTMAGRTIPTGTGCGT